LKALVERADRILVGGAIAYTFMRALEQPTGDSTVELALIDTARDLLERAGDRLWLPSDHVVARSRGPASGSNFARDGIADGWSGCDIGPETIGRYRNEIARAATLVWNGPMGRVEQPEYLDGTRRVAEAVVETVVERDAFALVGGVETGAVMQRLGLTGQVAHVSAGGGAFLDYIAHGTLPALEVLQDSR
jgi:phosphoglycerate kinase